MSDWFWIVAALIVVAGALFALVSLPIDLFEEYLSGRNRRQFADDLSAAVKHGQPTWDQLVDIASTRGMTSAEVFQVLQRTLRDVITGRDEELGQHQALLEQYISRFRDLEPFEGIPNEIRLHLERINEQLPDGIQFLQPLNHKIRELLALNERDRRQQRYYTIGGFVVGALGLAFAAFAYFYPYTMGARENQVAPRQSQAPQDTDLNTGKPNSTLKRAP